MTTLLRNFWPTVPATVRDDLALMRFVNLRAQVPVLYMTTIAVVVASMLTVHSESSIVIRFVLPIFIIAICCARLAWWLTRDFSSQMEPTVLASPSASASATPLASPSASASAADGSEQAGNKQASPTLWSNHNQGGARRPIQPTPHYARQLIGRTTIFASIVCGLASLWSVMSWLESVSEQRVYYLIFMVIGAMAASFCLSFIRCATTAILVAGIGPVIGALIIAGDTMDRSAAGIIALGSAFLIRMIQQHHNQLVHLLRLQQEMSTLAATDPLTGLGNRRALFARLEQSLAGQSETHIALIDLDGFKPVNDAYGHATGDRLLAEVAGRLSGAAGERARVFRLGGDEFAVIPSSPSHREIQALVTVLLASLAKPFVIDGERLQIGASAGCAQAVVGDSVDDLISRADARLYAAKAMRQTSQHRSKSRSSVRR